MSTLLRTVLEILVPERMEDSPARFLTSVEALTTIYSSLIQLAGQIEAHADSAPYPHVASRLRQIAREKENNAATLKQRIQRLGGWVGEASPMPISGKNHWQRLMKDLDRQRELEYLLSIHEPRLITESPELAETLRQLRAGEATHRRALMQLVAVADPQASQT